MTDRLHHNPQCTTSRRVLSALREAVRTREHTYREARLSDSSSDAELLDAMVANPRLIQRPIVVTDKGVRIPRPVGLLDEIV